MAAPDVVVQKGEKVVYEVKVKWSGRGSILIRWTTSWLPGLVIVSDLVQTPKNIP